LYTRELREKIEIKGVPREKGRCRESEGCGRREREWCEMEK